MISAFVFSSSRGACLKKYLKCFFFAHSSVVSWVVDSLSKVSQKATFWVKKECSLKSLFKKYKKVLHNRPPHYQNPGGREESIALICKG